MQHKNELNNSHETSRQYPDTFEIAVEFTVNVYFRISGNSKESWIHVDEIIGQVWFWAQVLRD